MKWQLFLLLVMMKKATFFFLFIATLATTTFYSCKTNTDDLWDSIHQLDGRVTSLEELCKQMNGNISSLQKLVQALQDNNSITKVTPVKEGDKTIGYTISFTKGEPITIYHGEKGDKGEQGDKGNDGNTPVVGVKQHTDGTYYWTLNGDWLRDQSGNMIKAEGKDGVDGEKGDKGDQGDKGDDGIDGKDGITPLLEIRDGRWYLSVDSGKTWSDIGQATGEDGDTLFANIDTNNQYYVTITLTNGTILNIPKYISMDIELMADGNIVVIPDVPIEVPYTIIGAGENAVLEAIGSDGIKVQVVSESSNKGHLKILVTRQIDEYSKVILFLSENERAIVKALTFEEGVINVNQDIYNVGNEGEVLTIPVESNIEYKVSIEESAKDWISQIQTRATSISNLYLSVAKNTLLSRSATIMISDMNDKIQKKVIIVQKAAAGWVEIEDPLLREVCIRYADKNKDGLISIEEAENTTHIDGGSIPYPGVKSLNGLEYFVNLESLTIQLNTLEKPLQVFFPPITQFKKLKNIGIGFYSVGYYLYRYDDFPEGLECLTLANATENLSGTNGISLVLFNPLKELTLNHCEIEDLGSRFIMIKGSKMEKLRFMNCACDFLTEIFNVRYADGWPQLKELTITDCEISGVFPNNSYFTGALESVNISGNKFSSQEEILSALPNPGTIISFDCSNNQLSGTLDLTVCTSLKNLNCSGNPNLNSIILNRDISLISLEKDDMAEVIYQ